MIFHAHELEEMLDKRLEDVKSVAIRGMLTQAYASSTSTKDLCKVVWMGHPSLYRIAYVLGRTLFISNWRSAEPHRMKMLLNLHKPWTAPITQAHFIRETLALASVDPHTLDRFLTERQKPNLSTLIVKFLHLLKDPFDTLARIVMPKLVLGDDCVHGSPSFLGKAFPLEFLETVTPRFVWKNENIVGPEELQLWRTLAQCDLSGIPTLLGTMVIKTSPNKGQTIIFMTNCGDPVGDEGLDPEEGKIIRLKISAIIMNLHRHGFHHHDLHGHNIVSRKDKPFLIDFGHAVGAPDCKLGDDCPDLLFLQESADMTDVPDLVPSSSQSSEDSNLAPSETPTEASQPSSPTLNTFQKH
ncbi:hypothetical protein C8R44DRAFT_880239 [Mycena epipterygia]|nr:hypothetical protein C8R44DRAFT_880239 [Mycena epipterygia]